MVWSDKRKRELPPEWQRLRSAVLRRDKRSCRLNSKGCGRTATEVDHIGDRHLHTLDNLQAVCAACHSKKTNSDRVREMAARRALKKRPAGNHPGLIGGGVA